MTHSAPHPTSPSTSRTARLVTRRARWVLALGGLAVVLAAVVGAGALGKLKGGGFDDPSSPSSRAQQVLEHRFGVDSANLLLLVSAHAGGTVDSPAVVAAGRVVTAKLAAEPGVRVLTTYWSPGGGPTLRSRDATRALVVAHVAGSQDDADKAAKLLQPRYTGDLGPADVATGGIEQGNLDVNGSVTKDLASAESLAVPLTLVLLLLVFGSVVAGLLPLLVGGVSIVGTFATLGALVRVTDVSIFALNLTTALGIGLGVDYSLLVVSRYREELAGGASTTDAIATTLRTAGRTIVFSAATVAVALSAMLVFPLFFLRSFAYAGIAVVAVATVAALVLLPALLMVLGPRVERLSLPWTRRRGQAATRPSNGWARLASFVMRRPLLAGMPVLAVLLLGAVPLTGIHFGIPDDRVLQTGTQARQVGDIIRGDFASQDGAAMQVVLPQAQTAAAYPAALSALPGVARVATVDGVWSGGRPVAPAGTATAALSGRDASGSWLSVVPSLDPNSSAAEHLVRQVRALPAPGPALVAGQSAALVDGKVAISDNLWLAGLLITVSTFVLLFLFTGSVVLPIKALLLNVLTLGSVLGVMSWIFVDGHLSGLLGFTPGPIAISMPILLFCVAFGLSMDYEVFLLSRIKEEHDRGAATRDAVAAGLSRTGRIVTTAAVLLAITFFAFGTSGVSFIQFFGIGTGLAIVVDATLVRGVLVPALMRVLGEANWWAPAPLRRLHARIGLREALEPEQHHTPHPRVLERV